MSKSVFLFSQDLFSSNMVCKCAVLPAPCGARHPIQGHGNTRLVPFISTPLSLKLDFCGKLGLCLQVLSIVGRCLCCLNVYVAYESSDSCLTLAVDSLKYSTLEGEMFKRKINSSV